MTLAIGNQVLLRYTGEQAVPLYLANTWATVVGRTPRGRVIVRPDLDTESGPLPRNTFAGLARIGIRGTRQLLTGPACHGRGAPVAPIPMVL
jgi:hypothetical protein